MMAKQNSLDDVGLELDGDDQVIVSSNLFGLTSLNIFTFNLLNVFVITSCSDFFSQFCLLRSKFDCLSLGDNGT